MSSVFNLMQVTYLGTAELVRIWLAAGGPQVARIGSCRELGGSQGRYLLTHEFLDVQPH